MWDRQTDVHLAYCVRKKNMIRKWVVKNKNKSDNIKLLMIVKGDELHIRKS